MEVNMKGGLLVPETFRPLQQGINCCWGSIASELQGTTQHLNTPSTRTTQHLNTSKYEICEMTQPFSPCHKSSIDTTQSISISTIRSTANNTPLTSRHSSMPHIVSINDLPPITTNSFHPIYNNASTAQLLTDSNPSRPTASINNASTPQRFANVNSSQSAATINSPSTPQHLNPPKRLAHSALRLYMNHITFGEFQRELLDILPSLSNYRAISTEIHFQFLADCPADRALLTETLDPCLFSEFRKVIEASYFPQAQKASKKSKSLKSFWQNKGVCAPLVFDQMKRKTKLRKVPS